MDLIDRPLNMPGYPSHATPPGSSVDLDPPDALPTERLDQTAEWKRQDYRDEVLQIAARLFEGRFAYGAVPIPDREMIDGIQFADRLIRAVDKFVKGPEPAAKVPLLQTYSDKLEHVPLTADEWADLLRVVDRQHGAPAALPCARTLLKRGLVHIHKCVFYPTNAGLGVVDRERMKTPVPTLGPIEADE
jgi:hypothetical protein